MNFDAVLKAIDPPFVEALASKPLRPTTPQELTRVLRKIGIERWAEIVGRYFDSETSEDLRVFVDGELTFLYYLARLHGKLKKARRKEMAGEVQFEEIIQKINASVIFEDIAGPVVAEEDKSEVANLLRKAGVEEIVAMTMELVRTVEKDPVFYGKKAFLIFIKGALSALYYLINLKKNLELEKLFAGGKKDGQ